MESYTLPTCLQLKQRAQIVFARLSTLPEHHPIHGVVIQARIRSTYVKASPQFPVENKRTMDLARLQSLETIDPRPLTPWGTPAFIGIDIEPDREKPKKKASVR